MKKLLVVLFVILASVSVASADTIYLRGGTSLRGTVLGFINGRFAVQLTADATLPANPNNRSQSSAPRTVSAGEVIFCDRATSIVPSSTDVRLTTLGIKRARLTSRSVRTGSTAESISSAANA